MGTIVTFQCFILSNGGMRISLSFLCYGIDYINILKPCLKSYLEYSDIEMVDIFIFTSNSDFNLIKSLDLGIKFNTVVLDNDKLSKQYLLNHEVLKSYDYNFISDLDLVVIGNKKNSLFLESVTKLSNSKPFSFLVLEQDLSTVGNCFFCMNIYGEYYFEEKDVLDLFDFKLTDLVQSNFPSSRFCGYPKELFSGEVLESFNYILEKTKDLKITCDEIFILYLIIKNGINVIPSQRAISRRVKGEDLDFSYFFHKSIKSRPVKLGGKKVNFS